MLASTSVAFLLTLYCGDRIRDATLRPRLCFVDKLCIPQCNEHPHKLDPRCEKCALKATGIMHLDEYVDRSRTILVLWDESYLKRLFCVVEMATALAAWQEASPDALRTRLVVWPLKAARFFFLVHAYCLGSSVLFFLVHELCSFDPGAMLTRVMGEDRRLDDRLSVCASVVMFALASLPACFLMVPRFRELNAVRKTLDEQLGSFRVSNAHTSRPEDEAALLAKISQLYPAKDGQSSTSAFEAFVRGPLRSTVSIQVKGGWLVGHSRLPRLVSAFLPWVWVFADAICEHPTPMLVSRFPVSAVFACVASLASLTQPE